MTTLVEEINAALSALASAGGVWVMVNTAESGTYPYIVFQRIVSTFNNSLTGPSNVQNTRVQVDVFDRQYRNAAALAAQVQASLTATFSSSPKSCVPLSSFDQYEDAIKAFRVSADYSIWYDESTGLVIGGVWDDTLIWDDTSIWVDGGTFTAAWDDALTWVDNLIWAD